jgi:RNA polymerase-associated protein RTF1
MLTGIAGRLNEMPEVEREQILAQRQEQMQSRTDKFNLSKLLAAQDIGGSMADDSVAQAAKRASVLWHLYHHNMNLYAPTEY